MHKIAFPQMGDYHVPIKYFLSHILDCEIIDAPKITSKTAELGSRYSPDFVCTPFKYTLGTYIECLDKKADTLIQLGGGCRYGYYHELQEKILKDLGYDFTYINLVTKGKTDVKKIVKEFKRLDKKFSTFKASYYSFITIKMIKYMDKIDDYIRENIGFEVKKDSFKKLKKEMLKAFSETKNYFDLYKKYRYFNKKFKNLEIKDNKKLKVGVIGELYTVMEPFANYELEYELSEYGISIKRFTNAYYLLFRKRKEVKKYLKYSKKYIKYKMGADAADNIGRAKWLCENDYDGIIHIKSSFCTPEIGAMPIITKICNDYNVPVIYFSFDTNTSKVGMKTRCEAFYDMIEMRKNDEKMLSRD